MTAAELIQELLKLDPTTIVAVDQGDDLYMIDVVAPGGLVTLDDKLTSRLLPGQASDPTAAACVVLS
jgi:hypothetical protein